MGLRKGRQLRARLARRHGTEVEGGLLQDCGEATSLAKAVLLCNERQPRWAQLLQGPEQARDVPRHEAGRTGIEPARWAQLLQRPQARCVPIRQASGEGSNWQGGMRTPRDGGAVCNERSLSTTAGRAWACMWLGKGYSSLDQQAPHFLSCFLRILPKATWLHAP